MFTRIALMLVVLATLCGAAFSLGSRSSVGRQDASGIPPEHPVVLALHYQHELGLSEEQIQKLTTLHDALAKEFAPFREQADSIQHRMQDLQQSGRPDPEAGKKLKEEADALGENIKPLFERYAQQVGPLLTDEQRQKLMQFSKEAPHPSDGKEFVLDTIMKSRTELEITPQQFTKLQYLLADFIRAFAPVREEIELLQMAIQSQFINVSKQPTPEFINKAQELQGKVAALQTQFSDQAIKDVLDPKQRTKLEELLHGEHRSATGGG